MSLVLEPSPFGWRYCRETSVLQREVESRLLSLYAVPGEKRKCQVLPSGMAAIHLIFEERSSTDGPILIGNELYTDTFRNVDDRGRRYKNRIVTKVDVRDSETILKHFQEVGADLRMFFIESMSNPSGQMFDFTLIPTLKAMAPNCLIVVDNTWLSGAHFNPFLYGADVVVESLTKYVSGGKCIGGAIISSLQINTELKHLRKTFGYFVGSDHCQIFLDGLKTLKERMSKVAGLALALAQWLENRDEVSRVMYPFLESHPTYSVVKKLRVRGPGVIWFHLRSQIEDLPSLEILMRAQEYLPYQTSYGSAYSRIDPWPEIGSSVLYNYQDYDNPVNGIWFRLALGYNDDLPIIQKKLEELFHLVS